jgi:hypothetical protein
MSDDTPPADEAILLIQKEPIRAAAALPRGLHEPVVVIGTTARDVTAVRHWFILAMGWVRGAYAYHNQRMAETE